MCTVVQKFGGSSLSHVDKITRVAERISATFDQYGSFVVVVSARGDSTDRLLLLASEVGGTKADLREVDQLLATGEIASAAQLAMMLKRIDVPAVSLSGPQAGIKVDGVAGNGFITTVDTTRVHRELDAGRVPIVGGFHGIDDDGDVVTLGRGGSDTTALALAVALGATRCEIYTDVDGVYTVDPRMVDEARRLSHVDSDVMMELAFAGAKVLHSRSAELAAAHGVEVHVRNAATDAPGTVISNRPIETIEAISAIACDMNVARVLICSPCEFDLAPEILRTLSTRAMPVDLVARSGPREKEFRMGFTVATTDLETVRSELLAIADRKGAMATIDENVSKVSVIGTGLLSRPEYVARMTAALAERGVDVSWVALSQTRASVTVPRDQGEEAVRVLHKEFQLEQSGSDRMLSPHP